MAHDDHRLRVHAILVVSERSADDGQRAQGLKKIAADVLQVHLLGGRGVEGSRNSVRVGDSDERLKNGLFARQAAIQIGRDR